MCELSPDERHDREVLRALRGGVAKTTPTRVAELDKRTEELAVKLLEVARLTADGLERLEQLERDVTRVGDALLGPELNSLWNRVAKLERASKRQGRFLRKVLRRA